MDLILLLRSMATGSLSAFSAGATNGALGKLGAVRPARAQAPAPALAVAASAAARASPRRRSPDEGHAAQGLAARSLCLIRRTRRQIRRPAHAGIASTTRKAHFAQVPEFLRQVPDGDTRERLVCRDCGHVSYENPKVVVGSVVAHQDRVLLCRRAIEPRIGYWTLPAGYLEMGESVEEGAIREAYEEAEAHIELDGILAVYSISRIGQVQVMFRARFADDDRPAFAAGPESAEVGLFAWSEIPWDDIAFPSVRWSLDAWQARAHGPLGAPAGNPAEDPRGVRRLQRPPGSAMRRTLPVLAVLLAPLSGHAGSVTTPIAPTTPTTFSINTPTAFSITAPSGFTPAPVPNQDITPGPASRTAARSCPAGCSSRARPAALRRRLHARLQLLRGSASAARRAASCPD